MTLSDRLKDYGQIGLRVLHHLERSLARISVFDP